MVYRFDTFHQSPIVFSPETSSVSGLGEAVAAHTWGAHCGTDETLLWGARAGTGEFSQLDVATEKQLKWHKWDFMIPSGKHTKNYGKSPFSMGKSTINGNFQ